MLDDYQKKVLDNNLSCIDRYAKYLFENKYQNGDIQRADELQGMITQLINEIYETLGFNEDYLVTFHEYIPHSEKFQAYNITQDLVKRQKRIYYPQKPIIKQF
jgi:hypothetical protein